MEHRHLASGGWIHVVEFVVAPFLLGLGLGIVLFGASAIDVIKMDMEEENGNPLVVLTF
jgi:hypothetical protein